VAASTEVGSPETSYTRKDIVLAATFTVRLAPYLPEFN